MSQLYAGVDLGGMGIDAVIADASGGVLGAHRRPNPSRDAADHMPIAIAASVNAAVEASRCDPTHVRAVGIGCPTMADHSAGCLDITATPAEWAQSFPLADRVQHHVQRPVIVDNDVRLTVAAEIEAGCGHRFRSFLGVYLGTGVGAGLVVDGRLWHGSGTAGEFGHTVVKYDGRLCACGRHGCVEAYCGRAAMENTARELARAGRRTVLFDRTAGEESDPISSEEWARAMAARDPLAVELIEDAQEALGAGLASAANFVDIDGIVLGGDLPRRLGEPFRAAVDQAMERRTLASAAPPIVLSRLSDYGGAVGAALLAREAV